jgi:uncharacterized protein YqiB (DUF1249 family)
MNDRELITQQAIFKKLMEVVPELREIHDARKSKSGGYMDLHLDVLRETGNCRQIALSHYYRQNGDSVPDPDMEIHVDLEAGVATATSFQDTFLYTEAGWDDRSVGAANRRRQMNCFLLSWLCNLKDQGHRIEKVPSPEEEEIAA